MPTWQIPPIVGQAETPRNLGGVVTPVLAGFALAAVALLVSGDPKYLPPLHDGAVLAFVIAVALLLAAMQFSAASVRFASRPAERLDLVPEARVKLDVLNLVRHAQHRDRYLEDAYYARARVTYNIGLLAFLVGLGLMVWPSTFDVGTWAQTLALVVVAISIVLEVLWIGADRLGRFGRGLFPNYESVPDDQIGTDIPETDAGWQSLQQK